MALFEDAIVFLQLIINIKVALMVLCRYVFTYLCVLLCFSCSIMRICTLYNTFNLIFTLIQWVSLLV